MTSVYSGYSTTQTPSNDSDTSRGSRGAGNRVISISHESAIPKGMLDASDQWSSTRITLEKGISFLYSSLFAFLFLLSSFPSPLLPRPSPRNRELKGWPTR